MDNQTNQPTLIQILALMAKARVQNAKLLNNDKEFAIAFIILAIVAIALPKNLGVWLLIVLFLSALLYSQRVFSDFRKLVGIS